MLSTSSCYIVCLWTSCYILHYVNHVAPSLPPNITSYEALDPSTVLLLWSPPPSHSLNGKVQYYLIHTEDEQGNVNLTEEQREFTVIVSLTPAVNYMFKVAAVTVGEGPYSDPVHLKMPEDGDLLITYIF